MVLGRGGWVQTYEKAVSKRSPARRTGGLQQAFLRVQADLPHATGAGVHLAGTEQTSRTMRRIKVESAPRPAICPPGCHCAQTGSALLLAEGATAILEGVR